MNSGPFVIRDFDHAETDALVALALRAWERVFASTRAVLGDDLDRRLHGPEWSVYQADAVRATLQRDDVRTWVAAVADRSCGFVVAYLGDPAPGIGVIEMLAVDPPEQRRGIGTQLTEHATAWLRESGMRVAMVETGGDPGHLPARRTYELAGYTLLPVARYFRSL